MPGTGRAPPAAWQDDVRRWATSYTAVLSRHPQAVLLIVSEQVTDEPTLQIYEALTATLAHAGFTPDQVLMAISMLESLAFGASTDAASPAAPWKVDPEKHPGLAAAIDSMPPVERQLRAFKLSLNAIVKQLERTLSDG